MKPRCITVRIDRTYPQIPGGTRRYPYSHRAPPSRVSAFRDWRRGSRRPLWYNQHAVAPGLGAAIGHGPRIVGKSVDKTDQFRDATGQNGSFPVVQSSCAFQLVEQLPKGLGQRTCGRNCRITLAELIKKSGLAWGALLCRTNHHERSTASEMPLAAA
jgi:hypothetical protein